MSSFHGGMSVVPVAPVPGANSQTHPPVMNALTRNFPRVLPAANSSAPVPMDVSLYGVVAAIAVSLALHAGLVISWLTAGRV